MSADYFFKFIIIGDSSVGKSCLLLQFTEKRFRMDHQATIGVEFAAQVITVDDALVKLQIWDTAGLESFRALTQSYYRGASGCLLIYDITQRCTFNSLPHWLQQARDNSSPNLVIMLVGNKTDLRHREVSYEEGAIFARDHGLLFVEASALTGHMVDQAFHETARAIYINVKNNVYDLGNEGTGVRLSKARKPGTCSSDRPCFDQKLGCCG